jgi:hypothetical protein
MTRVERRGFIVGTLSLLAAPLAAETQQTGRVYRIGILSALTRTWQEKAGRLGGGGVMRESAQDLNPHRAKRVGDWILGPVVNTRSR